MKKFAFIAVLVSVSAFGQNPVEGMPNAKGVYYKTGDDWTTLQWNLMFPTMKNELREYLSIGKRQFGCGNT